MATIEIKIRPRETMTWDEFCLATPACSIALDGMVSGGPKWRAKDVGKETSVVILDHLTTKGMLVMR